MTEHDNLKLWGTMNYCKSDLKKGCDHKTKCKCKPLMIIDMNKKVKHKRNWVMDLYDENRKPVRLQCKMGNSKGKAKASGARAVLEILR